MARLKAPPTSPATFVDARAQWDRAEIRGCLEALSADPSPQAGILAARCYIRLNRPHDALERLGSVSAAVLSGTDLLRGVYAVVTATAHFLLGDAEMTDAGLREARIRSDLTGNRALQSNVDYVGSLVAWSRRKWRHAETGGRSALHAAPTATWRARAFEILGVAAGGQSRHDEQIAYYERAWTELDEGYKNEPWLRGALLQTLSELSRELRRPDLAIRVSNWEQTMTWTQDTAYMRFNILCSIGWCPALSENYLRRLREASEIAPSDHWLVLALVERSSFAQEMGERLFARDSLEQAKSLAAACDWSGAHGKERYALLRIAELVAPSDDAGARKFLEIYRKKLPPLCPHYLGANDDRVSAAEAYTFGVVALHGGDAAFAIERLRYAFMIWRRVGYTSRAVDAARHLARLTGEEVFTEYVGSNAPALRNTRLTPLPESAPGEMEQELSETALRRLKGTHVELLRLMLRGTTKTIELSERTGYAERTVINKLQYIYSTLGVRGKIGAVNLCHTDPGLKGLLASARD